MKGGPSKPPNMASSELGLNRIPELSNLYLDKLSWR